MKEFIICLLLIVSLISCQHTGKDVETSSNEQAKNTRIDTAQAIANMNIREKLFVSDLLENDMKTGLQNRIDTVELMYIAYACDCPHWVVASEYRRVDSLNYGKNKNPTDAYVDFNNAEYSYYIEPASKELLLPEFICVNGNIIRFIGRTYIKSGYPADADFMDPNPPKGKVFRYYGYGIIRPYKVYGVEIGETVDSIEASSELTVK